MTTWQLIGLELALFLSSLLLITIGRRLTWSRRIDPASASAIAPLSSTVQALMGLVLAFSLSDASNRLNLQRRLIVNEANAIDTAWQRIDLLDATTQRSLRELFRRYVDLRILAHARYHGWSKFERYISEANHVHVEIWRQVVTATDADPARARILMANAVAAMRDTSAQRVLELRTHLSGSSLVFILGIVMIGSLLMGSSLSGTEHGKRFYPLIYAAVVATAIHVIMDLEYPRSIIFSLAAADQFMLDLRKEMN